MSRFVDEQRGRFGVEPMCRTLGVSASAYYQRATAQRCARAVGNQRLLERIEQVHAANYHCYGYRRTWKALKRDGVEVGRDRVKRLMGANGIQGAKRRGKPWPTTTPDPGAVRPPDRVQRDFTAAAPDQLWVADFCYLRCWEGVVFFSFVIDVYSRRIVGWQLASHMPTNLVLDALGMALSRRRAGADVELVHHSDAGSRYTSYAFGQVSTTTACSARSRRSATPTTTRWPRASSTPFKTELIAERVWRTPSQLALAVVEYVGWFNHDRLHAALGDLPPAQFEQRHPLEGSISGNGSVAALWPKPADRLYAPRLERQRASDPQPALSATTDPRPTSPASIY